MKIKLALTKLHLASAAPDLLVNISFEAKRSRSFGQVAFVIRCDHSLHEIFKGTAKLIQEPVSLCSSS